VHRFRHWSVTTCNPQSWISLKIAYLRYPFCILFLFLISFNFYFLPCLFLSTILCCFILSLLYSLLFISSFPSACVLLYFLCFFSLYFSFSVLRLSQFLQPQTSYLVLTYRWNQQPSILAVLSYTNRSVNTIGSEELKSLIHEIKQPYFFSLRAPCLLFNILLLPKHAAGAECAHIPHVCFALYTALTLLSNKCLFPLIYNIQTRKFRVNAISRDF
jgi:hypothetical protein